MALEGVNDFVIRFANVNGSGSASANAFFTKAVFRMGVPISAKNIFPSNIQGLPTWYELRLSERGYLGRRGGYDVVVALNAQTIRCDYDDLASGGYFIYDSTKPLSEEYNRTDLVVIGIPLTTICERVIDDPRLRQLLKNMVYVGALAALFDMELSSITSLVDEQFSRSTALAKENVIVLEEGFAYAATNYGQCCELSVQPSSAASDHIMISGNRAAGLGALYGGATVAAWYPITPSTSLIEAFTSYVDQYRLDASGRRMAAVVQAEDEMAAVGIAIGASWSGARGFAATSGPGLSLMNEFLGLAYFAEIPVVVMDVQRAGPSTGMPTRTQQSDILLAAYASHGDTKQVLLFPCDPRECFEMSAEAFDIADELQTPVLVMSDLDLGMNDQLSRPLQWDDNRRYRRGKVLSAEDLKTKTEQWGRYLDVDGDGICYRTYPGTEGGAYFTRGTCHNQYAGYSEDAEEYQRCMQRLAKKWQRAKDLVPTPRMVSGAERASCLALFYGTTSHAAYEALDILAQKGVVLDSLRLRAFPFADELLHCIDSYEKVFVIEQNRDGQMRTLLINEGEFDPHKLCSITYYGGLPIAANHIVDAIERELL